jgi:hypothetical protein
MPIPSIAKIFTYAYWIVALCLAVLTPHNPSSWFDIRGLAGLAFAIPTTIFLWTIVFILRVTGTSLSSNRFIAIGIGTPVACVGTFVIYVAYHDWRSEQYFRLVTDQMSEVTIDSIEDEPLLDAKGPIGVRIQYRVTYPKGLDMEAKLAPTTSLFGIIRSNQGLTFLALRKVVAPQVSGIFPPGSYAITEDLLPVFMPVSILPAKDPMSAAGPEPSDQCFRWSWALKREDIERAPAQSFFFSISPGWVSDPPNKSHTSQTYRLADFLATAVQEGALDCGP